MYPKNGYLKKLNKTKDCSESTDSVYEKKNLS